MGNYATGDERRERTRATTSRNQSSAAPPAPRLTLTITRGVFSRASTRSLSWSVVQGRDYLCSFCQTTSILHTLPVMCTRTVPSRSIPRLPLYHWRHRPVRPPPASPTLPAILSFLRSGYRGRGGWQTPPHLARRQPALPCHSHIGC